MFNWDLFPWTDYRGTNLEWIIRALKQVQDDSSGFTGALQAETDARIEGDDKIMQIINSIPGMANQPTIITVAKSGGRFDTISAAIDFAKGYATPNRRVVLLIDAGTYTEDIDLAPNPGIDMVGMGTTIQSANTGYPHTALYTAGAGYFRGITFVGASTYGMHLEVQGLPNTAGNTVFDNCNFYATANSAAGVGLGKYNNVLFTNCLFNTPAAYCGVYIHNYPGNDNPVTAQFDTCNFSVGGGGALAIDDAAIMANPDNVAHMIMSIRNCTAYLSAPHIVVFRNSSDGTTHNGVPITGNIFLRDCHSNNADQLTYREGEQYITNGIATLFNNYYRCTLPSKINPDTTKPVVKTLNIVGIGNITAAVDVQVRTNSIMLTGISASSVSNPPIAASCELNYAISFVK